MRACKMQQASSSVMEYLPSEGSTLTLTNGVIARVTTASTYTRYDAGLLVGMLSVVAFWLTVLILEWWSGARSATDTESSTGRAPS